MLGFVRFKFFLFVFFSRARTLFTRAWYQAAVSRAFWRLHVSTHLALVACFPVCLVLVTYISTLCTNCIFSRTQHWLHICLAHGPVTYFPTLGTTRSCISVSAQHCLHIFYALGTISIFSRDCQLLHIFLPLALVVSLPRLREGYVTLPFRDLVGSLGRIGLD